MAFILLPLFAGLSAVQARDPDNNKSAPLPLAVNEYKAFVEKLAAEVDENDAAIATRLRALGFSCTPTSKSVVLRCVRFGCQKRGILPGSLLQWTVQRGSPESRTAAFSGAAMTYSWLHSCIPKTELLEAQQRFLSGDGPMP
jgi:hypothetical protein